MVFAYIIGSFSILLNGITLLAILKIRERWTNNIRFVISLTISDIITSLTVIADCTVELSSKDTLEWNILRSCITWVIHDVRYMSLMNTMMILTLLAIDLYLAIRSPLRYAEYMTHRTVGYCAAGAWIASLLMGSAALYAPAKPYFNCVKLQTRQDVCTRKFDCNKFRVDYLVCAVLCLTVLIMTIVYTHTLVKLRSFQWEPVTASSISHTPAHLQQRRGCLRRNRRGLVTTFIILLTFLACFLPYFIITYSNFLAIVTLDVDRVDWFEMTKTASNQVYLEDYYLRDLLLINGLLDPILYAFRLRDVRGGYQRLFCFHRSRFLRRRGTGAPTEVHYTSGLHATKLSESGRQNRQLEEAVCPETSRRRRRQQSEEKYDTSFDKGDQENIGNGES